MRRRLGGESIGLAFVAVWVFTAFLSLAFSIGLYYVAWHFIAKFW